MEAARRCEKACMGLCRRADVRTFSVTRTVTELGGRTQPAEDVVCAPGAAHVNRCVLRKQATGAAADVAAETVAVAVAAAAGMAAVAAAAGMAAAAAAAAATAMVAMGDAAAAAAAMAMATVAIAAAEGPLHLAGRRPTLARPPQQGTNAKASRDNRKGLPIPKTETVNWHDFFAISA